MKELDREVHRLFWLILRLARCWVDQEELKLRAKYRFSFEDND